MQATIRLLSPPYSAKLSPGSIFKRKLPQTCVAFDSKEGKALLEESIKDSANAFLALNSHVCPQQNIDTCGHASASAVLNALNIDPKKSWNGHCWRYFSEHHFAQAVQHGAHQGINLDELQALIEPIEQVETNLYRPPTLASPYGPTTINLPELEDLIKRSCNDPDEQGILIASFSRQALNQTGDGHFSPIGAYSKIDDKSWVLMMDTAPFKYPYCWIETQNLFKAINTLDPNSKKIRGVLQVRKAS